MCVPELLRPPLLTLKSILHLYSRILNRLQLPELLHSVHHQHHLFCNHSLLPTYLLVLLFISPTLVAVTRYLHFMVRRQQLNQEIKSLITIIELLTHPSTDDAFICKANGHAAVSVALA